jgi:toxin ParE1/3/4
VARRPIFAPESEHDLIQIYQFIAEHAGLAVAMAYVERIEESCFKLLDFPERGARRDDLRPGLRVVGFERRASIAFHFDAKAVTIDRILYAGRDVSALGDES